MLFSKYKLNSKYEKYTSLDNEIINNYASIESVIYKGRNELKFTVYDDLELVIKSFRVPHILNGIIYRYFRDSKAKRSYYNSLKLLDLGVLCPDPILYRDTYKNNLLRQSYFVSKSLNNSYTLRDVLSDSSFKNRNLIIAEFVGFVCDIQEKNVFHKDLSAGNILIKEDKDLDYKFYLVDLNRLKFSKFSAHKSLKNFNRLSLNESDMGLFADAYAKIKNLDRDFVFNKLKLFCNRKDAFFRFKRTLKSKILNNLR